MKIQRISIAMLALLMIQGTSSSAMQRIQNFFSGLTEKSEAQAKLNNALLEAIHALQFKQVGAIDRIKKLLAQGASPNAQGSYGYTPLHYAVKNNDLTLMKLLLDNKADPNIPNARGKTPLMEIWEPFQLTIVYPFKTEQYIQAISLLFKGGAKPNMQDTKKNTALFYAVEANMPEINIPEIVKLLLDNKADPTIKNEAGITASDKALAQEKYPLLVLFANAGFLLDIEKPNADGETILMQALAHNKPLKDIQALIQLGANPYVYDSHGLTAFDYTNDPIIHAILQKTKHMPAKTQPVPRQKIEERERERENVPII